MDKLDMQSKNLVDENISKIAELFPNCITEGKNEEGQVVKLVDFDLLKQELSKEIVEGNDERYTLNWAGKKQAILTANSPINATLRPCREESVDFDSTKNLYIEGDNLDVLKLLRETYLGKVKMIYIDPPYNTGNDFVYEDDFATSAEDYLQASKSYDEQGNRMFQNNDSNGRFHSDWLSMMYTRLKLAKDLLTEDGAIFISIDDNEQHNLRRLCNEVFGEQNFITEITREAIKGGSLTRFLRNVTDYVLIYAKDVSSLIFGGIETEGIKLNLEDENGKYAKGRELNKWGAGARREDSPGMWFPVPGPNGEDVYPIRNDGSEGRWRLSKANLLKLINNGDVIYEKRKDGTYIIYEKIRDDSSRKKQFTNLFLNDYINSKGSEELKKIFNTNLSIFDYSKPSQLIYSLLLMANTNDDDIIIDFFSGSATTAHAVMKLNADDGGNRHFIMVQLPENCDEKSEAYKAGFKNICEIGKERIRRVGNKIKKDNQITAPNLDVGFRVLKLDSSCMKEIYYTPNEISQNLLERFEVNIKEDRTAEDLLFQVMLNMGVMLSSEIKTIEIKGKKVFNVNDGNLVCCFDNELTDEVVTEIAKLQPLYAVFRDSSMSSDSVAVNFDQIFETYSPTTTRKII